MSTWRYITCTPRRETFSDTMKMCSKINNKDHAFFTAWCEVKRTFFVAVDFYCVQLI